MPSNATAVVLNVTATETTAPSFLTVWPAGEARPTASNLNWVAGQTVPNLVTAKLGQGGRLSIYNLAGTVDVIADVAGYYVDTTLVWSASSTLLTSDSAINCPTGQLATGGGISELKNGFDAPTPILASGGDRDGWRGFVQATPLGNPPFLSTIQVFCLGTS
jgi:hypothetical protein